MKLERITIDVITMRVFHYWRNDDGEQVYTMHSAPDYDTQNIGEVPDIVQKKKKRSKPPISDTESISEVHQYTEQVLGKKTLTDKAKHHINARLKNYDVDRLKEAIDHFAGNKWRMDNNADKPLSWFFRSDEQIETFLCLVQDIGKQEEDERTTVTGRWT